MQFRWNLQLLIRYSLFRSLPGSAASLLTFEAVSLALDTPGVTRTIALDI